MQTAHIESLNHLLEHFFHYESYNKWSQKILNSAKRLNNRIKGCIGDKA